jgi:hypothetical protein
MKSWIAAATAVSAVILDRAPLLGIGVIGIWTVLIVVLAATAVYSSDDGRRKAARKVLRILLGRPRG